MATNTKRKKSQPITGEQRHLKNLTHIQAYISEQEYVCLFLECNKSSTEAGTAQVSSQTSNEIFKTKQTTNIFTHIHRCVE